MTCPDETICMDFEINPSYREKMDKFLRHFSNGHGDGIFCKIYEINSLSNGIFSMGKYVAWKACQVEQEIEITIYIMLARKKLVHLDNEYENVLEQLGSDGTGKKYIHVGATVIEKILKNKVNNK
ncbi:hypothetical protein Glove_290g107 [Diversispora epigaea]|uniref:Uncharacterized protein n=1 Tax=Diversispora epigaea TaxID=1348612 RepID=A0A397I8A9_9GLOM|nr:hypothetical protein Glove_290g107 [Diversispora epigaea]